MQARTMTIDQELPEDEYLSSSSSPPDVGSSRTNNKQRDLSFDMTETSDHDSSTGSSSIVVRNTGTTGKFLLLLTAVVALMCSIYTILSCKFLIVQGVPSSLSSTSEGALFVNTTKAIGIFSYSTQDSSNPLEFTTSCLSYDHQFWESDRGPLFWSAQLSALLAPSVGGLALMIQLIEMMRRQFLRNFLLVVFLYLMASLIQAYTFAIYGALDFCWGEDEYECTLSETGYVSVAAAGCYYLCVLFLCFVPRQAIQVEESNPSKTVVSEQDHMVPPIPPHPSTSSASSGIILMEEGQRSVRFEDPIVSQTMILE